MGDKFGAHPVCCRALQVRRSRGPGSHRVRAVRRLLEQGRDPLRQDRIRAHRRFARAPREPQVRAARPHRALRTLRTWRRSRPTAASGCRSIVEIGYQGITINIGKSDLAQKKPAGRIRACARRFELSLDRDGIVQVAMEGEGCRATNGWRRTNSWYSKADPVPRRDVALAKALLAEAGVTIRVHADDADHIRRATLAQVVQAMAKEAGFDVKIQSTEFVDVARPGGQGPVRGLRARVERACRSGRQPHSHLGCKQPLNYSGYCNARGGRMLATSAPRGDRAERQKAFDEIAVHDREGSPDHLRLPPPLALGVYATSSPDCARCLTG